MRSGSAQRLRQSLSALIRSSDRKTFLETLNIYELDFLLHDWQIWARDDQMPPRVKTGQEDWTSWLIMGGRGAGKTRAGAEWVRGAALGIAPFADAPLSPIALIGENLSDVRAVMIEGVSGLLAIHPKAERPHYEPSKRRLEWPNGAVAQIFSADDPESLRGPQFAAAWCDELAKWRYAEKTWDMLQFGLRIGAHPKQVMTTTPRPIPLIKKLLGDPAVVVSRANTKANAVNLSPVFLDAIVRRYENTRLGRQELEAELLEDRPDALWQRAQIDMQRVKHMPSCARIVVALDPPTTSKKNSDACGIIVAALDQEGRAYVLGDETLEQVKPLEWARRAVKTYYRMKADCLIAEVNQGGEMVESIIRQIDPLVPVRCVHATRGKWLRAEPIAALYEQGRVAHVGQFAELEDQMCDFGRDGLSGGRSPDRLDALVWALTELLLNTTSAPRIQTL